MKKKTEYRKGHVRDVNQPATCIMSRPDSIQSLPNDIHQVNGGLSTLILKEQIFKEAPIKRIAIFSQDQQFAG